MNDITNAAAFLLWLQHDKPYSVWGGVSINDAVTSFCTLLDIDETALRIAVLGEVDE